MRATTGFYAEKLDHLRALAVFLVFFWHFVHGSGTHPLVPFAYAPPTALFPLSLFEQGQVGVALFMVLSGYLFARIVGSGTIAFVPFMRNRALRLLPLLSLVVLPGLVTGRETAGSLLGGFLHGWSADGTWSIAVELQFYVLLPAVLWLGRNRLGVLLCGLLVAAFALRTALWINGAELADAVAYSLVGRADNFLVGMALASLERRRLPSWSRRIAAILFVAFLAYYHAFNLAGGLSIDARSALWIVQPTIESFGFAALIHLYCGCRFEFPAPLRRALAAIGAYSYSIYLLHFACVVAMAPLIAAFVPSGDFWIVSLLALPAFLLCVGIGGLSYTWIEKPFLRLRVPYVQPPRHRGAIVEQAG